MIEKRRNTRSNVLKGARINWQVGTQREVSYVSDLSRSGLFIETTKPTEGGTVLDLFWEAPGKEMRARAIVRRSVPGRGMGVEFIKMEADEMTRLLNLLRAAGQQESSKKAADVIPQGKKSVPQPGSPTLPAQVAENPQIHPAVTSRTRSSERRTNLRHKVAAVAEVVEIESGQKIKGRLGDLGRAGCFVIVEKPCPVGRAVNVHIAKGAQSFEVHAKVAFTLPGKGMGLLFAVLEGEDLRILDTWLEASVETSWSESNRRRSQRIVLAVQVQVVGHSSRGEHFTERTHTVSISPHGAMVLLSKPLDKGQLLTLRNIWTDAQTECAAVYIAKARNSQDQYEVGLSFVMPNRAFWSVAFPPADWSPHHPDAKGSYGQY